MGWRYRGKINEVQGKEVGKQGKSAYSFLHSPPRPRVFLFYLYSIYIAICRPSDHNVLRPRVENRTGDVQP